MEKKKKTNKGYTLVEMIIVVTIIMFLVTAIAINNNLMRDQVQFSKAFHEVQSVLQYGRNIALSGQAYPDTNDHDKDLLTFDPDGDMVLPNGYIIRLYVDKKADDPIEVGLYADLFDSNLDQLDIVKNGKSDDVPVKEIVLPDNIRFKYTAIDPYNLSKDWDEEETFLMYRSPNADYEVLESVYTVPISLQIEVIQVDENEDPMRSKFIFIHHLYGIPEVLFEAAI